MIKQIGVTVNKDYIKEALALITDDKFRTTINQPTGNFFYDPWILKEEFKNTVWEKLLSSLPQSIGEARIILLNPGNCYHSHSDIDDRYHLNLQGQYSYLIDLDDSTMFETKNDSNWYIMDAGKRHVAANFGSINRIQLVVRKLLNNSQLNNSVDVEINPVCEKPRFEFDDIVSPWLNKMNKLSLLKNFRVLDNGVAFQLESSNLLDLDRFPKEKFRILIKK